MPVAPPCQPRAGRPTTVPSRGKARARLQSPWQLQGRCAKPPIPPACVPLCHSDPSCLSLHLQTLNPKPRTSRPGGHQWLQASFCLRQEGEPQLLVPLFAKHLYRLCLVPSRQVPKGCPAGSPGQPICLTPLRGMRGHRRLEPRQSHRQVPSLCPEIQAGPRPGNPGNPPPHPTLAVPRCGPGPEVSPAICVLVRLRIGGLKPQWGGSGDGPRPAQSLTQGRG